MSATIWGDIKYQFQQGNAMIRLLMINVAAYIILSLIRVPIFLAAGDMAAFESFLGEWFYFPSEWYKLLVRPWTIITYMFLHGGFLHILSNMLFLYWFGRILNDLISNQRVFAIYFLGGIVGAFSFIIAYSIFPVFAASTNPLVGASGSIMAIILAAATLNPRGNIRLLFIGNVELRYLALFAILYNMISIPGGNPGGVITHLGGALMGYLFIVLLRNGRDLSKPFQYISNLFRPSPKPERPKKREPRMVYKKVHREHTASAITQGFSRSFAQKYNNMTSQECLDAILEKIHISGYDSLTEDEKAFLDTRSKNK